MKPYFSTKNGDLYHGDCLQVMQVLDVKVDLVLSDPPYGTQDCGGGYGRRELHDNGDGLARTILNDQDLSIVKKAFPFMEKCMIDGFVMLFFSAKKLPDFIDATNKKTWFGNIVWDKLQPGLGFHIRYCHEDIGVFRYGEPKRPANAIMSVIRHSIISKYHPHENPVELIKKLIEWGAEKPQSLILDPFAGSGTTAVACELLGRRWILVEQDESYCEIAAKRIKKASEQFGLFEGKE